MPHGGECAIACKTGWTPSSLITCHKGEFQLPRCVEQVCPDPVDAHGTYTHVSGTGINATWKLSCDEGWISVSTDLHARCSSSKEVDPVLTTPEPCVFVGGCLGNTARTSTNAWQSWGNGTTCRQFMEEGETCAVTCTKGQVVGQFTCVMMQVAG